MFDKEGYLASIFVLLGCLSSERHCEGLTPVARLFVRTSHDQLTTQCILMLFIHAICLQWQRLPWQPRSKAGDPENLFRVVTSDKEIPIADPGQQILEIVHYLMMES